MASSDKSETKDRQSRVEVNEELISDKELDAMDALTELSRRVSLDEAATADVEDTTDRKEKGGGERVQKMEDDNNLNEAIIAGSADADTDSLAYSAGEASASKVMEEPRVAYRCNCGECFEKSSELAAHKRWTCLLVEKKLQCDICKSWFAHEHGLRRHMKHLHKGDFSCSLCSLKFHNRIRLTRHWMEVHYDDSKGDKLKCFLCGDESFKSKFELESHLLLHKYNRSRYKVATGAGSVSRDEAARVLIDLTTQSDGDAAPTSISPHRVSKSHTTDSSSLSTTKTLIYRRYNMPPGSHSIHSQPHHSPDQRQQMSSAPNIPTSSSTSSPFMPGVENWATHHSHHHGHHHRHHHHPPPPPPPPPPPHHHPPPFPPHHPPPPPSHHHHRHPINPPCDDDIPPPWVHSPYMEPHHHHHPHPFFRRHCKGKHHHNKWKWKQYYKEMMLGQGYSPTWHHGGYYPGSSQMTVPNPHLNQQAADNSPSRSKSPDFSVTSIFSSSVPPTPEPSEADSELTSSSFKMVCKFCNQIIEKGKAAQHRLRDCPYIKICGFKCNVCGKVFTKRHRLLQHMSHSCHTTNLSGSGSNLMMASRMSSDMNSISNLQKQLDSVLDFHKTVPATSTSSLRGEPEIAENRNGSGLLIPPSSQHEGNEMPSNCLPLSSSSVLSATSPILSNQRTRDVSCGKSPGLTKNVVEMDEDSGLEEPNLVIDDAIAKPSGMPSTVLHKCVVCRAKFDSVNVLSLHLQAHVTHVTAVQKVHEWKEKSLQYFSDSSSTGKANENSSAFPDNLSTSTTDASFQDGSSVGGHASSLNATTIESSSVKGVSTITESEKWLKPHCEKKRRKKNKDWNKMFSCEHCDENFLFKKALSQHMKEKHPDVKKKLECPVCQKKFSWKKRGQFYERHLSSHFGVTIFKHRCSICDKTFLEKGKFRAHMAIQHGKSEELLHTCHVCGKVYGTKSSLTRHLRQHTGDKPHRCSVCQEGFLEKRELIRHMAVHTGQPAFVCVHCDQGFTLKTSLDTHMRRKHPEIATPP